MSYNDIFRLSCLDKKIVDSCLVELSIPIEIFPIGIFPKVIPIGIPIGNIPIGKIPIRISDKIPKGNFSYRNSYRNFSYRNSYRKFS